MFHDYRERACTCRPGEHRGLIVGTNLAHFLSAGILGSPNGAALLWAHIPRELPDPGVGRRLW